jgi:hypothetical protein
MNALCSAKVSKKLKARMTLSNHGHHNLSNQSSKQDNRKKEKMIAFASTTTTTSKTITGTPPRMAISASSGNDSQVGQVTKLSRENGHSHNSHGHHKNHIDLHRSSTNGKSDGESQNHRHHANHHIHYVQPPIVLQRRKGMNREGGLATVTDVDIIRKSERVPLNGLLKDRVVTGREDNCSRSNNGCGVIKETSRSTDDLLSESNSKRIKPIMLTKKKCRPQSYAEPKKYRPLSYAEQPLISGSHHHYNNHHLVNNAHQSPVTNIMKNGSISSSGGGSSLSSFSRGRYESMGNGGASFNGHRIAELEARLTQLRIQQMHRRKSVDFAISCVEPDPTYFYVGQVGV